MTDPWRFQERDGLLLIRCAPLEAIPGLSHAFTTRVADGRRHFDTGGADPSEERFAAARRRAARAAGLRNDPLLLRQVHGRRLVNVAGTHDADVADGAFWTGGEAPASPAVRTADCVPLLLAHREGLAAAAVHAGWRGIAAGIVEAAAEVLDRHGFPPCGWIAAVGPAIGPCCYEVGPEVIAALGNPAVVLPRSGPRLDLAGTVAARLEAAGLPREAIHVSPWCTRCRGDLFHSHRGGGPGAGRMLAVIGPACHP